MVRVEPQGSCNSEQCRRYIQVFHENAGVLQVRFRHGARSCPHPPLGYFAEVQMQRTRVWVPYGNVFVNLSVDRLLLSALDVLCWACDHGMTSNKFLLGRVKHSANSDLANIE